MDFLNWFSKHRFFETTGEVQYAMDLAAKLGVPMETIEHTKHAFDALDNDQSGTIGREEFTLALAKVMRIPPGVDLPRSRVNQLWQQVDTSNDGSIDFEEFLAWWLASRDSLLPYENFYKSVRDLRNPKDPLVNRAAAEEL
eukprot:TRINITY_DN15576_c0_g1_i2.p2 TRINITY_DN15576_c0_g1~~TRINITY_DN15576_c0_g1_i2.p2  ORF type:complete len:141 (-),score=32.86 TRINITY_DN15576_c0_g1_i2:220-642(-)